MRPFYCFTYQVLRSYDTQIGLGAMAHMSDSRLPVSARAPGQSKSMTTRRCGTQKVYKARRPAFSDHLRLLLHLRPPVSPRKESVSCSKRGSSWATPRNLERTSDGSGPTSVDHHRLVGPVPDEVLLFRVLVSDLLALLAAPLGHPSPRRPRAGDDVSGAGRLALRVQELLPSFSLFVYFLARFLNGSWRRSYVPACFLDSFHLLCFLV